MFYALINRQNIVVDVLLDVRYIKLQSSSNIAIGCEEKQGTGVIGSDGQTIYTLIRADRNNSPDAVAVMAIGEKLSDIKPGFSKYNSKLKIFEPRYTLVELQGQKQEENKNKFASYLASHPLTWTDGKKYGITQEDQNEINLALSQYQSAIAAGIDAPILEWHAKKEESVAWAEKDLIALNAEIIKTVNPIFHTMQQYKTAIYSTTTAEELDSIQIEYADASSTDLQTKLPQ